MKTPALALALTVVGCAHGNAAVQRQANEYAERVNAISAKVAEFGPDIATACEFIETVEEAKRLQWACKAAKRAYAAAQLANRLAARAIAAFRETGLLADDLARAIARMEKLADEADEAATALVEGVTDVLAAGDSRGAPAREGVGEALAPDRADGESGEDPGPAAAGAGQTGPPDPAPKATGNADTADADR